MGVYGIDLGTTYSCIAKLDENGNPEVIENFMDGSHTLASAVYFEKGSDNVLVGESAKAYQDVSPERLVQFAKREIGKPNGKVYKIDDKEYTPIEISALILKKLKEMAEEQGETVSDVIITCPAYFGLEEVAATKKAGELAGMNVLNIVHEPTAAAINYCYREFQDDQVILVYDLGGGTFDVTIFSMSMIKDKNGNDTQQMKVLASCGNDRLGGKDWDDILYEMFLEKYCMESEINEEELYDQDKLEIKHVVEKAKQKLSSLTSIRERFKINGRITEIVVTRDEFKETTKHMVLQTMNLLDHALQEAKNVEIDKVLLVGGSTYMPMIRNAVEERFPGLVQCEDPDKAVAKGAAIYASILVNEIEKESEEEPEPNPISDPNPNPGRQGAMRIISVLDQTSRSFGVGIMAWDKSVAEYKYVVDNLILRGAEIPATATRDNYVLQEDNQDNILVRIFESMALKERVTPCVDADGNPQDTDPEYLMKVLGTLTLELPPNTPKETRIEVTFMIDGAGLSVTAKNLTTGDSNSVKLEYTTSMTEEQKKESLRKLNGLTFID